MPQPQFTVSPALRDIISKPSPANIDQFDPWNSSSTGHQRAENPYTGTSWRETRNQKLAAQLKGTAGDTRLDHEGEWKWVTPEEREKEIRKNEKTGDIRSFFGVKKRIQRESADEKKIGQNLMDSVVHDVPSFDRAFSSEPLTEPSRPFPEAMPYLPQPAQSSLRNKGIFSNLTIYINGSTFPLISDHKVKQILVNNGASISISLARRTVTHVILGRPNALKTRDLAKVGAGGGLSAGKLQREIQRISGKGVKFVGVEWVLESIKAGRRLPEARFANLHTASVKQRSVMADFAV
ncbi:hypothetical protein D8B26_002235 [Coccidioides posadasii str. Silveira]|uniref:Uncharacterized protein n=1 Tax=Coccidioides posadasii (strain RMSCC 757 / Silveira) TaxID=443226 RepID=E9DDF8_COCPS|nr:conserved hypothetical protein [Coccidioides posadasii str. Silveira]QVM07537.1 hypothetical protein D8B26_002235 [Coccidioides posadasii str. Silveira]